MLPDFEGLNLTDNFITMLMTIVSGIGTNPVVMFVLKLSSEEKKMRTEPLLASQFQETN